MDYKSWGQTADVSETQRRRAHTHGEVTKHSGEACAVLQQRGLFARPLAPRFDMQPCDSQQFRHEARFLARQVG